MIYNQAKFLLSAAELKHLPADMGVEVAFAGRSNAGKSSAINAITHIRGLAHTSKTPGRTQLINLFTLDETRRLVDLPGYGYAKVPQEVKARWQKTLARYLAERQCLKGLILVMDIRHPLKNFDQEMLTWAVSIQLPVHILLTKADKLSRNQAMATLLQVQNHCADYGDFVSAQCFSVPQHKGLDEARKQLDTWFFAKQSPMVSDET